MSPTPTSSGGCSTPASTRPPNTSTPSSRRPSRPGRSRPRPPGPCASGSGLRSAGWSSTPATSSRPPSSALEAARAESKETVEAEQRSWAAATGGTARDQADQADQADLTAGDDDDRRDHAGRNTVVRTLDQPHRPSAQPAHRGRADVLARTRRRRRLDRRPTGCPRCACCLSSRKPCARFRACEPPAS